MPVARLLGIVMSILMLPAIAHAEIRHNLRYSYYDVNAHTGNLYEQLRVAAPKRAGSEGLLGYTVWNIRWMPTTEHANGQCSMKHIMVDVDADIQLPRLGQATERQRQAFERFMKALLEHEQGHAKIATLAAEQLEREVMAIQPEAECISLEAKADAIWSQIWNQALSVEREYDRLTQHGKTQGAWLTE